MNIRRTAPAPLRSRNFTATLLTVLALTPLLLGGSSLTRAQDNTWYRVELLIFTQGGAAALRQEYWNPQPLLAYPDRYRFLVDPRRVARRAAGHPGLNSSVDSIGRQIIGGPSPGSDAAMVRAGADPASANPAPTPAGAAEPAPRAAFVLLPPGERTFRGTPYMQTKGGSEVLFPETGRQPVASRGRARAIILDDSGAEQRYPRLQGSITLYNERYLEVAANIWLNTDGNYLQSDWQMPAPPLGPSAVEVVAADTVEPAATRVVPYPFRHAIALQEARRMRSGETHYLDHPVLGVVIRLSPLSSEAGAPQQVQ